MVTDTFRISIKGRVCLGVIPVCLDSQISGAQELTLGSSFTKMSALLTEVLIKRESTVTQALYIEARLESR